MKRAKICLTLLTLPMALLVPEWVLACAVCYGDPASPHAKAATLSAFALMMVTVVVLAAFATFFVTLIVRARAARQVQ